MFSSSEAFSTSPSSTASQITGCGVCASLAPSMSFPLLWTDLRSVVLCNFLTKHEDLGVTLHLLDHRLVQRLSHSHLLCACCVSPPSRYRWRCDSLKARSGNGGGCVSQQLRRWTEKSYANHIAVSDGMAQIQEGGGWCERPARVMSVVKELVSVSIVESLLDRTEAILHAARELSPMNSHSRREGPAWSLSSKAQL